MAIAVEHQFVTPLTALLVESQDASERLLADSPKDPKHGCCPGQCPATPTPPAAGGGEVGVYVSACLRLQGWDWPEAPPPLARLRSAWCTSPRLGSR